jgi:hypothetical protein
MLLGNGFAIGWPRGRSPGRSSRFLEIRPMCFSAGASFAVAAALLPAGAYCVHQASRKGWRLLPLALVPAFFGAQQFAEGFVWRGLEQRDLHAATQAGLAFLFFALWFWPVWIPLSATSLSLGGVRGRIVLLVFLASLGWLFIYAPVFLYPQRYLAIEVKHHSIAYDYSGLPIYEYIPLPLLRFFYGSTVALPMVLAWLDSVLMRWCGVLFVATIVIAQVFFAYAYASVWCFFAAVLSAYLCLFFHALPGRR